MANGVGVKREGVKREEAGWIKVVHYLRRDQILRDSIVNKIKRKSSISEIVRNKILIAKIERGEDLVDEFEREDAIDR